MSVCLGSWLVLLLSMVVEGMWVSVVSGCGLYSRCDAADR